MDLTQLLKAQLERRQEPAADGLWATIEALGAFAQSRRENDRETQLAKLAELLGLALDSVLTLNPSLGDRGVWDAWGLGWEDGLTSAHEALQFLTSRRGVPKIFAVAGLAQHCGYSREEVEAAYLDSIGQR